MPMPNGDYGKELVLDLHECNTAKFNKKGLQEYFDMLCDKIRMDQEEVHFWEYAGGEENPEAPLAHLKGTSALQFIKTSSIVIHTLDDLKKIYINVFSCKDFDEDFAAKFTEDFFEGKVKQQKTLQRT
jgi:S-adenosylmethionine/arginine decarboxylase-like enzyme